MAAVRGDPDARFSLANERTFLAWARTSLAMIATGLVVGKLLHVGAEAVALALAGTLVVAGGTVGVWPYVAYRRADEALRSGRPLPRTPLPLLVALTLALAAVGGLALLLG
ncbi:MAG TPA: DUF202 domain-containing protein [Actinomycetota bacterium]|nr:DUF202 domain-containing protein [Actinomycetota bacterium]